MASPQTVHARDHRGTPAFVERGSVVPRPEAPKSREAEARYPAGSHRSAAASCLRRAHAAGSGGALPLVEYQHPRGSAVRKAGSWGAAARHLPPLVRLVTAVFCSPVFKEDFHTPLPRPPRSCEVMFLRRRFFWCLRPTPQTQLPRRALRSSGTLLVIIDALVTPGVSWLEP